MGTVRLLISFLNSMALVGLLQLSGSPIVAMFEVLLVRMESCLTVACQWKTVGALLNSPDMAKIVAELCSLR